MITEERILKVLRAPHISEKASMAAENANTIVFKVAITATKRETSLVVQSKARSKEEWLL
jgi:large subunit ribosomal protein L23